MAFTKRCIHPTKPAIVQGRDRGVITGECLSTDHLIINECPFQGPDSVWHVVDTAQGNLTSYSQMCYDYGYPKQPNTRLVDGEPSLSRRKSKGGGEKTKEWEVAWGTVLCILRASTASFSEAYCTTSIL